MTGKHWETLRDWETLGNTSRLGNIVTGKTVSQSRYRGWETLRDWKLFPSHDIVTGRLRDWETVSSHDILGLSDPVVLYGRAIAQRIKGTPGITG